MEPRPESPPVLRHPPPKPPHLRPLRFLLRPRHRRRRSSPRLRHRLHPPPPYALSPPPSHSQNFRHHRRKVAASSLVACSMVRSLKVNMTEKDYQRKKNQVLIKDSWLTIGFY
ncbi:protein TRACHEARY ELEMENT DIFFERENTIATION-RELATED 7A isoform X3 [Gossypium hirsutum]|uniref:Protein TRACHEARY ELEMENT DIFFERENTIATION-RELATED 7A isoform X3 n=1 Tax=Gossypium hirsutum TaxID=3635 RepID=A0ABM3AB54_GOSHI|nr:protein TRACHEARY ELEMENT DIFFERENTIATION-RELATED 7A-like isoform X3 [Gossypium hirsutum]